MNKGLIILILTVGNFTIANSNKFSIKNEDQKVIYFALIELDSPFVDQDDEKIIDFQGVEPGGSSIKALNGNKTTYVAIWESPTGLSTLRFVSTPTGSGRKFNIEPVALYRLKRGMPIAIVWNGKKLAVQGWLTKPKQDAIQKITVIS